MFNDIVKNAGNSFESNKLAAGFSALKDDLTKYHSLNHVLDKMLYAVELMEDNHKEMCDRLGVSVEHPHYVCHDALTYDYSFGEPVGVEAFFSS